MYPPDAPKVFVQLHTLDPNQPDVIWSEDGPVGEDSLRARVVQVVGDIKDGGRAMNPRGAPVSAWTLDRTLAVAFRTLEVDNRGRPGVGVLVVEGRDEVLPPDVMKIVDQCLTTSSRSISIETSSGISRILEEGKKNSRRLKVVVWVLLATGLALAAIQAFLAQASNQ